MKALFWAGLVIAILGVASFFLSVPREEQHGIEVGGASVGVETQSSQRLPPYVGVIMIVGGLGMMLAGGRSRAR
ncbi:MAG TPA: hypothetical protein VD837_10255 [Terriglobales bacterium]|nr:hypothetical protein [Terriglobales bacterium]